MAKCKRHNAKTCDTCFPDEAADGTVQAGSPNPSIPEVDPDNVDEADDDTREDV